MSRRELLQIAADHANAYLDGVAGSPVRATVSSHELRQLLAGPLPGTGEAPERVIRTLAEAGVRGTVATQGPRYFGFGSAAAYRRRPPPSSSWRRGIRIPASTR